ncbi:MAG: hypothetical protein ACXADD_20070 [Candidatus Thorarchaeota archaeon]|jgi:hypothetical protein
MSHIATVQVKIKNIDAVRAACQELGLQLKEGQISERVYGGTVTGDLSIKLPGWRYPMVIDTEKGEAAFDNYEGAWGDMAEFNKFNQYYSKHVALNQFDGGEYTVNEETLDDGTIEISFEQFE